jgi:hypothetical protein
MSLFSKSGNLWHPHREDALDLHPALPGGNYTVKQHPMTHQFFLERIDSFVMPERIYGDIVPQTNRILRTFNDRPGTTGVLLAGEKGSGKTLLSKNVCAELAGLGVPTIVINHSWHGDEFNAFIQSVEQPCAVLFDEFEKVYKREEQEQLLTLLDGVFGSKKLFLLTCNDEYRVDHHMRNRPGRIYYFIKFSGLAENFIVEYCQDNLAAQAHTPKIVELSKLFSAFNFDMLQTLIEEMNRFGEDPQTALALLNAKPEADSAGRYDVQLLHQGFTYKGNDLEPDTHTGSPLAPAGVTVEFREKLLEPDADGDKRGEWHELTFYPADFVKFDPVNDTFVFMQGDSVCTLKKVQDRSRYHPFAA